MQDTRKLRRNEWPCALLSSLQSQTYPPVHQAIFHQLSTIFAGMFHSFVNRTRSHWRYHALLDMGAGAGYSTELMARAVAPNGVGV